MRRPPGGRFLARTSYNKDLNELVIQSFKVRVFAPWTAVSLPARLREALEAQSAVSAPPGPGGSPTVYTRCHFLP